MTDLPVFRIVALKSSITVIDGELARSLIVRQPTRAEARRFYELGCAGDTDDVLTFAYSFARLDISSVAKLSTADREYLDRVICAAFADVATTP